MLVWFSLHHFPISHVLHPFKKLHLLPAIVISSHMEETQSLYRLKSFKERLHFLCAWIVETERPRKTLRDIWKLIQTSCIYARKFGYDIAYDRTWTPTARTPHTCMPLANITLDLAQILTLSCQMNWQLSKGIRWPSRGLRWKTSRFGAICKPM